MNKVDLDQETRAELLRKLDLIVLRLFDEDPGPAINRFRAMIEKHGLHPTQIGISIGGVDQLAELQRERDEAVMASWRDVGIFVAACEAKGYVGVEQIAKAIKTPVSLVREWKQIGRVPAVFFSILADVPAYRDREKEVRALMAEAKQRVRAESQRRAQTRRKKEKKAKPAKAPAAAPLLAMALMERPEPA